MERRVRFGVSMSMKLNLGNYQSADIFMSLGDVTEDTTPEEVARLLDGPARTSFEELRQRLQARLNEARAEAAAQAPLARQGRT